MLAEEKILNNSILFGILLHKISIRHFHSETISRSHKLPVCSNKYFPLTLICAFPTGFWLFDCNHRYFIWNNWRCMISSCVSSFGLPYDDCFALVYIYTASEYLLPFLIAFFCQVSVLVFSEYNFWSFDSDNFMMEMDFRWNNM